MKLIAAMIAALGVSVTGGTPEASPSAMNLDLTAGKGAAERTVEFRSKSHAAPDAMLVRVEGGTELKRVQFELEQQLELERRFGRLIGKAAFPSIEGVSRLGNFLLFAVGLLARRAGVGAVPTGSGARVAVHLVAGRCICGSFRPALGGDFGSVAAEGNDLHHG